MSDKCGAETTQGHPCQNDAESCPWHDVEETPDTGRPTKLSYERQEAIAQALEEGVPLVAACRLNDITHDTYTNWMEKGEEQEEGPYADFFGRLTRALGHDQREKTQALWKAAKSSNDTGTMLTILKQRYPETWGDTDIGEASNVTVEISDEIASTWPE